MSRSDGWNFEVALRLFRKSVHPCLMATALQLFMKFAAVACA